MSAKPAETLAAVELPAAGVWEIDPQHSTVEFVVRHMLTKLRGRFDDFSATIRVGERPDESSVQAVIQAASINSGAPQRDEHLRSADFLDAADRPTIGFRSESVRQTGPSTLEVTGPLTIRDVTREVTLEVEYLGQVRDPWGGQRASFSAATEIDRDAFGATWNVVLEAGGFLVGKKVRVELEIEAVRQA